MNIFIDIETIPQQPEEEAKAKIAENIKAPAAMKKQETIDAWHNGEGKYEGEKDALIEETYRKTSFDGGKGQICSIAYSIGTYPTITSIHAGTMSEKELLAIFFDQLKHELGKRAPYFIGHYIGGFDLRFLWQRAVVNDIKPEFKIPHNGRHRSDYFCTMTEWCGWKDRISMDDLANTLGVNGKSGMDGSMVWDAWKEGKHQEVADYNMDDVRMVRSIYNRMNF